MKKTLLLTFTIMIFFSGCAITDNQAKLVPHHDKVNMKKFYVVHQPKDERHIEQIISELLEDKGFISTYGPESNIPNDTDIVVTYSDRWMWDMSNYLIQLSMEFRNPVNNYPIVAGETVRTSLARKSPKGMSLETLDSMFAKMKGN